MRRGVMRFGVCVRMVQSSSSSMTGGRGPVASAASGGGGGTTVSREARQAQQVALSYHYHARGLDSVPVRSESSASSSLRAGGRRLSDMGREGDQWVRRSGMDGAHGWYDNEVEEEAGYEEVSSVVMPPEPAVPSVMEMTGGNLSDEVTDGGILAAMGSLGQMLGFLVIRHPRPRMIEASGACE